MDTNFWTRPSQLTSHLYDRLQERDRLAEVDEEAAHQGVEGARGAEVRANHEMTGTTDGQISVRGTSTTMAKLRIGTASHLVEVV